MKTGIGIAIAALAIAGCDRSNDAMNNRAAADTQSMPVQVEANRAAENPAEAGAKAAADAMRAYAALAEKGEFAKAASYWSDPGAAAQFAADLDAYPAFSMTIAEGKGGVGRAGATVPVGMKVTLRNGSLYDMACTASLRRTGDAVGAVDKPSDWKIQSIAC